MDIPYHTIPCHGMDMQGKPTLTYTPRPTYPLNTTHTQTGRYAYILHPHTLTSFIHPPIQCRSQPLSIPSTHPYIHSTYPYICTIPARPSSRSSLEPTSRSKSKSKSSAGRQAGKFHPNAVKSKSKSNPVPFESRISNRPSHTLPY